MAISFSGSLIKKQNRMYLPVLSLFLLYDLQLLMLSPVSDFQKARMVSWFATP